MVGHDGERLLKNVSGNGILFCEGQRKTDRVRVEVGGEGERGGQKEVENREKVLNFLEKKWDKV